MNKYKLNDTVFFVHGTHVVKGVVDEYILHYTQTKVIVKYFIRPYGLDKMVTIDADKVYDTIEEAKEVVINHLQATYKKENIIKNYEQAKENYDKQLAEFDSNFKTAIEGIKSITENYYNDLETKYQENKKESNND